MEYVKYSAWTFIYNSVIKLQYSDELFMLESPRCNVCDSHISTKYYNIRNINKWLILHFKCCNQIQ